MKKSISLLLLSLLMITPSCQKPKEVTNEYNIVPQPNQLVPKEGRFELSNKVRLVVPSDAPEVKKVADGFAEQLKQTAGISLTEAESVDGKPAISFVLQEGMPKEGYKLSVTPPLLQSQLPSQMDFSMVCRLFISFFLPPYTEKS